LGPCPFQTCLQVDRDPLTGAPACGDVGYENIVVRVANEVRMSLMDGTKTPLCDAPASTPVKLAFRTGIKHVPAKGDRAAKRVVFINAVEATEAPASRGVSAHLIFNLLLLIFYCFLTLFLCSRRAVRSPPHQLAIEPHESGDCNPNARFVRQPEGSASAMSPDSPDAGGKGKRAAASPAAGAAKRTKRA